MTFFLVASAIKVFLVLNLILVGVALLTLVERRVCAWMQDRLGPNRVGPQGLLQPAADGLKNFLKEETSPAMADKALFTLAPIVSFIPAMLTFGVIPFASPLPTRWGVVPMVVADLPVGFLYILAISSLGVYGIVLAGWASNNKYALLGGLRSAAQMISYELAMGLSTIGVLLLAGSLSMVEIVAAQAGVWQLGPIPVPRWFVFAQPLAFVIFMITAFAETNRAPFDLPEAEAELVAGFHTEYSSMKFGLFFLGEFANVITICSIAVTLFLGGWNGPWLPDSLKFLWFFAKLGALLFFFIWVRWTYPRLRYDQLMHFGWKVLLPAALANIVITSVWAYWSAHR
jgi:NADH-quinone oxidoreductase subunit H